MIRLPTLARVLLLRLQAFGRREARKIRGHLSAKTPTVGNLLPLAIYTDGAVSHDCNRGGWAFVAYEDGKEAYAEIGSTFRTTSTAEELRAVVQALEWLHPDQHAILWTDSQEIAGGTARREAWKARGWRRRSGRIIAHVDQWRALDALLGTRKAEIRWCPSHAGVVGNERADALAMMGRTLTAPASIGTV